MFITPGCSRYQIIIKNTHHKILPRFHTDIKILLLSNALPSFLDILLNEVSV